MAAWVLGVAPAAASAPHRVDVKGRCSQMPVHIDAARYDAVLFDLDGVITDTASVHRAAWKQMFDAYLAQRSERAGEDHTPFTEQDYRRYVDGRPRYDGVVGFLEARGISLPHGEPSDAEDAEDAEDAGDAETVVALGDRKNRFFEQQLAEQGVHVFDTSVALVRRLQQAGLGTAVFSASRNCGSVLASVGLDRLFPVRVDGVVAQELDLPGKPDPAVLLEAAGRLGADPGRCVVVEDAEAGVEAGARGGFALVIGVDRTGHGDALRRSGADAVVADLGDVTV